MRKWENISANITGENTVQYDEVLHGIYGDGLFTNRSEMSLKYLIDNGLRKAPAPQTVPDAVETLKRLGY